MYLMYQADESREAHIEIQTDIGLLSYSLVLREEIFSKMLRSKTVKQYKEELRGRIITKAIQDAQELVYRQVGAMFESEWNKVLEAFPVPLPAPVVNVASAKPKTKRCSRELSPQEFEAMRAKLLAELNDLTGATV